MGAHSQHPSACPFFDRIQCEDTGQIIIKVSFFAAAVDGTGADPETFFPSVFGVQPDPGEAAFAYEIATCTPTLTEAKPPLIGKLTRGVAVYLRANWLLPNMLEPSFYADLATKPEEFLQQWGGKKTLLSSAGWPPALDVGGKKGSLACGWTEGQHGQLAVEYLQWVRDKMFDDTASVAKDVYNAWHKREDLKAELLKLLGQCEIVVHRPHRPMGHLHH